jgi:hypothetical protein
MTEKTFTDAFTSTDDIKFNQFSCEKCTSLNDAMNLKHMSCIINHISKNSLLTYNKLTYDKPTKETKDIFDVLYDLDDVEILKCFEPIIVQENYVLNDQIHKCETRGAINCYKYLHNKYNFRITLANAGYVTYSKNLELVKYVDQYITRWYDNMLDVCSDNKFFEGVVYFYEKGCYKITKDAMKCALYENPAEDICIYLHDNDPTCCLLNTECTGDSKLCFDKCVSLKINF